MTTYYTPANESDDRCARCTAGEKAKHLGPQLRCPSIVAEQPAIADHVFHAGSPGHEAECSWRTRVGPVHVECGYAQAQHADHTAVAAMGWATVRFKGALPTPVIARPGESLVDCEGCGRSFSTGRPDASHLCSPCFLGEGA